MNIVSGSRKTKNQRCCQRLGTDVCCLKIHIAFYSSNTAWSAWMARLLLDSNLDLPDLGYVKRLCDVSVKLRWISKKKEKKRGWEDMMLGRPTAKPGMSWGLYSRNTNDYYIKHQPAHFDQNALKPQRALPLLTSEFINPVGGTARKHKIHWPLCSQNDLSVCFSAPPSLPDCGVCSLCRHSGWDNCIGESIWCAMRRPGNCSHQPSCPYYAHTRL